MVPLYIYIYINIYHGAGVKSRYMHSLIHRFRGIALPDDRDQAKRIICGSYLDSKRNEECAIIANEKRAKILPSLHLTEICILLKDRIRTSN